MSNDPYIQKRLAELDRIAYEKARAKRADAIRSYFCMVGGLVVITLIAALLLRIFGG